MPPRVDVIVNRNARRLGEASALRGKLLATAERLGVRVHETRTLVELSDAAQRIAAQGADTVLLAGGDGSCMAGVSALMKAFAPRALPPIGLCPAGTVCTIARNFGIAGARAAERVIAAAATGPVQRKPHPTLRVRDDGGGDRVGFIFGGGLVAGFFDVYMAAPEPGHLAAAGIAARLVGGSLMGSTFAKRVLGRTGARLTVDGVAHPAAGWSLILASVLRDVGLGVRVTYRAAERPDRFHVVASGLPPRALGFEVPRALLGRPLCGEPRVDTLAASFRVDFTDEGGGAYVFDGELFRARSVTLAPGPVLSLLVLDPTLLAQNRAG